MDNNILPIYETTIGAPVSCRGIGVHSGDMIDLTIEPAPSGTGIVFERTDVTGTMTALSDNVVSTQMCTTLGDGKSVTVATVEHLMAAFAALEIDNARVLVSGGEIPIMDGSATDFMTLLRAAGIDELSAPRLYMKVLKPIRVGDERSFAELMPSATLSFTCSVDFYGRGARPPQSFTFHGPMGRFGAEVARARTFGFLEDAAKLWAAGLSLGASLDNTVVFDDQGVLNDGGLRYDNECARHKVLDAIGDLALLGRPLVGQYVSHNGGHTLNHQLAQALLRDEDAFALVPAAPLRDVSIVTFNAAQMRR